MVFELFGEHLEDVDLDSIDIRSDLEIVSKELSEVVKNFEEEKNQNDFDGNEQNLEISGTKLEDTNPYCEIKVNQEFDELLKNPRSLSPQNIGSRQGKIANRTRFTVYQIKVLQEFFKKNAYPKNDELEYLSNLLGLSPKMTHLSPRVISVWFQNARQKKARKIYENQSSNNFDMNEQKLVISGTKQEDTNPYCEIEMKQDFNELLQNFEQFIENNEVLDIKDELRKEMSSTEKPLGVIHEEKMPLGYSKCLANSVKSHADAVHKVKKPFDYKCSTCPAKFESHSALKRHITWRWKKSIECPICHAKFCYTNELHRHVVLVHEGKAQFYIQLLFKPRLKI